MVRQYLDILFVFPGNFYCSVCKIHANDVSMDDGHMWDQKLLSLEEKQLKILQGQITKRKALQLASKPTENLKRNEMIEEFKDRNVWESRDTRRSAKEVKEKFQNLLAGNQCIPAVLHSTPLERLKNIHSRNYEVNLVLRRLFRVVVWY